MRKEQVKRATHLSSAYIILILYCISWKVVMEDAKASSEIDTEKEARTRGLL